LGRAKRLDGMTPASASGIKMDGILKEVAADDVAKF
jgi:hypothetical protein